MTTGAMSTEQLREQTRSELTEALSAENFRGVLECGERMLHALGGAEHVGKRTVLVAYGGGKDSAYMLAFVRAIQLLIASRHGETFVMRVVTNRHAGMPYAVMTNIDRSYRALRLYDDPACEMLLVDGNEINSFDVDRPQSPEVIQRNRTDILMAGHRSFGDGRPTFCNACNFSVAGSFGLAAAYDGGVDMIVTGDSPQEQRAYFLWICRMAHRLGVRLPHRDDTSAPSFASVLSVIDDIGAVYFADLHGAQARTEIDKRRIETGVPRQLSFFTIYGDTAYASGDHWELLTGFLQFRFEETAFNFTESDCANPALMAHLRALRCERLYGQRYAAGLAEYVDFATTLMRSKEIPEYLVEVMRQRYAGADAAEAMRTAMQEYAVQTFQLNDEHLICMVYSPFADEGRWLAEYLDAEHPNGPYERDRLVAVLSGQSDEDAADWLFEVSGLRIDQLRTLYSSPLRPRSGEITGANMLEVILEDDPHKRTVLTRQRPGESAVPELISGR